MSLIRTEPAAPCPTAVRSCGFAAAALAAVLVLVGAALRCHEVATLSIVGDEIYSVWETRSARKAAEAVDGVEAWKNRLSLMLLSDPADPPGVASSEVWRLRWGYRTNPLSLLINEAGFELLGDRPLAVRLGSLCFGLAALLVLPWMARPLLGVRGALLLLAFIALCPDVVEMSRDARYRSACFLFGGLATIAAARFAQERRARDEWICLVACALLVLSHLTGLLVAAVLFLYLALVARGRVSLRLLPVAAGLALLAWYFGPHRKVGEVIQQIQQGVGEKSRYPWWRLAASLVYNVGPAMLLLGLVGATRVRSFGSRAMLPVLAAGAVPALVLFWMNRRHDIGPRYFGAIVAAGLVLSAWGAEWLFRREGGRSLARAAAGLAILSQGPLLASNWVDGQRYPYAEAARSLSQLARPGDRILSNWSGILEYYLDGRNVVEMPTTIHALEERLREGSVPRAFLVIERQRGVLAWPRSPGRLERWLEARTTKIGTLGFQRLDSLLSGVGAGYRFELELHELDLDKLRATPADTDQVSGS